MATTLLKAGKSSLKSDLSTLVEELAKAKQQIERLLQHAETVLQRTPAEGKRSPRPSALDQVKEAIAATEDLRTANGNLSADRMAKLYGISLSQLADWLGRTRQALAKTPDADSLQEPLAYFERVARLTAIVSASEFRKWLRMPNKSVAGKQPLELMASGELQVIADLVDDMLTGTPG